MANEYSHIEIDGGVVQSATVTDDKGTRQAPDLIGKMRYYVSVIEKDGGCIQLWDGEYYEFAKQEARRLQFSFGVASIHDKTVRPQ